MSANFLLNAGGLVLPLATSLAVVPLYLATIGPARYGVLSILWVLLGYFGFVDFGLARACTNALSRLTGVAGEWTAVLVTTLWLSLGFGLLGAAVLYAAGRVLIQHSGLPPVLADEMAAALPWAALLLPATLVAEAGGAALASRERFLVLGLLETVCGVAGRMLPVLGALLVSPSLAVVIPAALMSQLLALGLVWIAVARGEPALDLRRFDRGRIRGLLGYGVWISVTGAVGPVLETFDQLLIGWLLGPVAVAHYAVPMSVASRSAVVCAALVKALFPRLSRLPRDEAARLAGEASAVLGLGFAGLCGPAIILAGPGLRLWVGAAFAADATQVAQVLLLGAWLGGVALVPAALLNAQGRPDLVAKLQLAELAPFLGGLWYVTTAYGLPGAAWAWAGRAALDGVAVAWLAGFTRQELRSVCPGAAIMAACWAAAPLQDAAAAGAAALAGLAAAAGLAVMPGGRRAAARLLPGWARTRLP